MTLCDSIYCQFEEFGTVLEAFGTELEAFGTRLRAFGDGLEIQLASASPFLTPELLQGMRSAIRYLEEKTPEVSSDIRPD